MKRKDFKYKDMGSYIMAYQRKGEKFLADLNFFDGDRNLDELKKIRSLLDQAIEYIENEN